MKEDNKNVETNKFAITDLSGSILINNSSSQNQYMISSKHSFFKNEYIKVYIDDYSLIFSIPTIDYNGKMYKSQINNNSVEWRYFSINNEFGLTGKFEIDVEDSSEDELVVYYR
tara:strand:+ start:77 stop:418 length:342 start_codon:yes stop_codon:yes gene_type:complete